MNDRLLAVLIIFPIWLTLVLVFRRHRQWLLYYLVAAFGLTIQLVFLAEYFGIDQALVNMASYHIKLISKFLFKLQMELLSNGRLQLLDPVAGSDILKLGIECSAILELSVIFALIIFYPFFNWKQKIIRATFGLVATYVINLMRLMIIVLMADKFGSDYIFLAHAGVARVFFFICELLLYWYLITKPTVKTVGDSIKNGLPLDKTAKVGLSFQRINAALQVIVITVVLGLSVYSFRATNEWQKAFAPVARKERPIIYQEETSLETETETPQPSSRESEKILGEKTQSEILKYLAISLLPQDEINSQFQAQFSAQLNIRIINGIEPIQLDIYLNNIFQNSVNVPGNPKDQPKDFKLLLDKPINVKPGDKIGLRFKNINEEATGFVAELIREGARE